MSKIDSDTRNTTVKRLAALKTFPTCIEVIFKTSKNKKSSFFLSAGQFVGKQGRKSGERLL